MPPTTQPLPELLQAKLEPLRQLCERYGVVKLELFGSAAKGTFDPKSSDIDLIAEFNNRRQGDYAARFLDFAEGVEVLLQRPVDLLTEAMLNNPYIFQAGCRRKSHHALYSLLKRSLASRAQPAQHNLND
jgi:predicted nucleotidyltransferase